MERITCEKCGREYENILQSCPECGHVNADAAAAPDIFSRFNDGQLFRISLSDQPDGSKEQSEPAESPSDNVQTEVPNAIDATDTADVSGEAVPLDESGNTADSVPLQDSSAAASRGRARTVRYRIPTWVLGALCGILGVAIIAGVIFIISRLTNMPGANIADPVQGTVSGQLTDLTKELTSSQTVSQTAQEVETQPVSSDETSLPEAETGSETSENEPESALETEDLTCQSISLSRTDVTFMYTGESFDSGLTVLPVALKDQVEWSVSNENLVSVDESGLVTALGGIKGETVTITASCQGKTASCLIRFQFNDDPTVLQLNYSDVTLSKIGETLQLQISSSLSEEDAANVVWMTDNVSAAAVDANGVVTAIASGTANITATLGTRVGSCIVRVR